MKTHPGDRPRQPQVRKAVRGEDSSTAWLAFQKTMQRISADKHRKAREKREWERKAQALSLKVNIPPSLFIIFIILFLFLFDIVGDEMKLAGFFDPHETEKLCLTHL